MSSQLHKISRVVGADRTDSEHHIYLFRSKMDDRIIMIVCKHQAKYRARECEVQKWPYITKALDFGGTEDKTSKIDLSEYLSLSTVTYIVNFLNGRAFHKCRWKTTIEILQHERFLGLDSDLFKNMISYIVELRIECTAFIPPTPINTNTLHDLNYKVGIPKRFIPIIADVTPKNVIHNLITMKIFDDGDDGRSELLKITAKMSMRCFKWAATECIVPTYSGVLQNSNESIYNYLVRKKYFEAFKICLKLTSHIQYNYNLMTVRCDKFGNSLLHTICKHGSRDVLESFVEWVRDYSVIHTEMMVTILYELTTAKNKDDELPIHLAAKSGNFLLLFDIVNLTICDLLTKQEVLQLESKIGGSLLHYAALAPTGTDTIAYLDREGVPIDVDNLAPNGMSILELAESVKNRAAVERYLVVRNRVNELDLELDDINLYSESEDDIILTDDE